MKPLDAYTPRSDAEVIRALDTHLMIHDERFRGARGRRNRRRAEATATKVLEWWQREGLNRFSNGYYGTTEQAAEMRASAYQSVIGSWLMTIALFFVRRWVEKLVTDLLVDWLTTQPSGIYRLACYSRRDAR